MTATKTKIVLPAYLKKDGKTYRITSVTNNKKDMVLTNIEDDTDSKTISIKDSAKDLSWNLTKAPGKTKLEFVTFE